MFRRTFNDIGMLESIVEEGGKTYGYKNMYRIFHFFLKGYVRAEKGFLMDCSFYFFLSICVF